MARIYWYPMGTGGLKTVDIDFLTGLTVRKVVQYGEAETLGGGVARSVYGQWERVTVERETISPGTTAGALLLRELRTLESHLLAGHPIGLANDADNAYLCWLGGPPSPGSSAVNIAPGNQYLPWEPTVTAPTTGEEYVMHGLDPDRREERHRVTGGSAISATLDELTSYDYGAGPVMFRHRYFWPRLRLHADSVARGSILIDEGGARSFALNMELREDLAALRQDRLTGVEGDGPVIYTGQTRTRFDIL